MALSGALPCAPLRTRSVRHHPRVAHAARELTDLDDALLADDVAHERHGAVLAHRHDRFPDTSPDRRIGGGHDAEVRVVEDGRIEDQLSGADPVFGGLQRLASKAMAGSCCFSQSR